MFERFTDNAKKVLSGAEAVARDTRSPYVRRHHVLIALLDDATARPEGIPALLLADAAVDLDAFRLALRASLTSSEEPAAESSLRYSAETKKTLELALREALSLGHNYIGCEHLLLSILRTADGPLGITIGGTDLRYGTAREFLRTYSPGRSRRRFRGGPRGIAFAGDRWTRGADEVIDRARRRAGLDRAINTGDLLVALSEVKGTHFSRLLDAIPADLVAHADTLASDNVVDGEPDPVRVDPRTGAFTIADEELAAKIKDLSADKIADALRKLVDSE